MSNSLLATMGMDTEGTTELIKKVQKATGVASVVAQWAASDATKGLDEIKNVDDMDFGAYTRSTLIQELSENATIYEQILPLNQLAANRLTPFLPGRAYFIPHSMPAFMEETQKKKVALIKKLITSSLVGFEGIQDETAGFATIETGAESNNWEVLNTVTGDTKEVTLSFPAELDGQPFRKFLHYWITGVYDRHSQIGHYFGANKVWGQGSHTMSGVYFVLDVKGRMPQYAAYCYNMMPKMSPESMNNYKKGSHDPFALNIPFTVQLIGNHPFATEMANHYINLINQRVAHITSRYRIDLMDKIEDRGLSTVYSEKID